MDSVLGYLRNNVQWLFSGIGGLALTALSAGGRALLRSRKSVGTVAASAISAQPEGKAAESIDHPDATALLRSGESAKTLADVGREIDALPIMLQGEALKHYIGVRVVADGLLGSLRPQEDGRIRVGIIGNSGRDAYMDVWPTEHPGLGLLREDTPVRLEGAIQQFLMGWDPLLRAGTITFGRANEAVV